MGQVVDFRNLTKKKASQTWSRYIHDPYKKEKHMGIDVYIFLNIYAYFFKYACIQIRN